MALDLEKGLLLRLNFVQDMRLEYRCLTEVTQEFSNAGQVLGKKEHSWTTKVSQRVIRQEEEIAHILAVSEPVGELPAEPIVGAQVARQVMYAQMTPSGNVVELVGGSDSMSYNFPAEPVHIGTTWTRDTVVVLPGMPLPAKAVNTFVVKGEERVGGYDCVRIDVTSSAAQFETVIPESQQKAKVVSQTTGSVYYAPELGVFVRLEMTTRSLPKIEGFLFSTITKVVQDLLENK